MEDEIDLRQYITVLMRYWKLIVAITVLAGGVTLAVVLLTPQIYETKSRVYIMKVNVVQPPEGMVQVWSGLQSIPKDFADQLLLLAKSDMIAEQVSSDAVGNNKSGDMTVGKLLGAVKATQQGNSIEFTVQHKDPAQSAYIANAWAQRFTEYVNKYFHSTGQTPEEARRYAEAVKKIYMEKQKTFLDFMAVNPIDAVEGGLDDRDIQLMELTVQRDAALKSYEAALVKVSEAEIAQVTSGGYVRVADKAVTPDTPLPDNKKWVNVVIALVIGLVVGVIGAFVVEYFSKPAKKPEGNASATG